MRFLIVDDHPLVSAGLESSLKMEWPSSSISIASNLAQAKTLLRTQEFDAAIVDINLPDGQGGQLFSDPELAGHYPRHSLILSGSNDRDDIFAALSRGATAYVSKSADFKDLMQAVCKLSALDPESGPYWYDTAAGQYVPARNLFPRGSVLSTREHEIYSLIRDGLSDKEIAFRTGRSIHTVRVQIRSIRRKRGGETRRATASSAA